MSEIRIILHSTAIDSIGRTEEMRSMLLDVSKLGIGRAKSAAPKRTGAGAASIHTDAVLADTWEANTSWDQLHYYMRFHEFGTSRMPARPFLRPAFGA